MKNLFKRFFNKFFVLGIFTILIAVIINITTKSSFCISILIDTLKTIGIALTIGAIFDFSKNSNDFMEFISDLLKEIIISKNFLNGLDDKEKMKALEMVLRPSGNQLEQYPDIAMYFNKKINDSMEMFHTNFKTNLVVNADAKKEAGIVSVHVTLTYRVYKIEDKYFPLTTTFERNGCEVEKSTIIYPNGQKEITENDITNNNMEISPMNVKTYEYDIPDDLYKYPYLTIKKTAIERGYDHWTNFHWNTLTPTDGIIFSLRCHDNLHIQEYFMFDDEDNYNVTEDSKKQKIDIISTVWLEKNSGFVFTISDTIQKK